jgi:hypothetical protein
MVHFRNIAYGRILKKLKPVDMYTTLAMIMNPVLSG